MKKIKLRKNFFPTLVMIIFLWSLVIGIIFWVEPETFAAIPIFFLLVFLALLFTASTLFTNTRRGFLTAMGLTFFLILRYWGIGNVLNLLFVVGILISLEIYFSKN